MSGFGLWGQGFQSVVQGAGRSLRMLLPQVVHTPTGFEHHRVRLDAQGARACAPMHGPGSVAIRVVRVASLRVVLQPRDYIRASRLP